MHLQSLFLSAVAVSSVSLGWGALDKPSASNLIWSDEPAVVVYPQEDKNPDGNFGKYKKPSAVWEAEGYPNGNGGAENHADERGGGWIDACAAA